MTRNRSIVLVVLLGALVALAGAAEAQTTLETMKKRGKLVAGVKTDFPPFGYVDAGGKNLGFDVDVAHLFAKALFNDDQQVEISGQDADVHPRPFGRAACAVFCSSLASASA